MEADSVLGEDVGGDHGVELQITLHSHKSFHMKGVEVVGKCFFFLA